MGLRAIVLALGVAATACSIRVAENDDEANRAQCGNGHLDPGEVCDDNNVNDNDGCSADCTSDESCGNGVVDTAVGESCDDGNALGGDGCSEDCKSTEECGNGVTDLAKGETCDDGNLIGGDMCSANCQSNEQCGNGITDPATVPLEQCDDGAGGSATCNLNCTTSRCGDGIVNPKANEQCDDANTNNGDQCDNQCRKVLCGDSKVTGNEQCDDGNSVSTDACISCKTARCGDGFVQAGVEQCDDSNTNNGDGCDANCHFEPITYDIDVNGLVNQDGFCDGTGVNHYDNCDGQPSGFTWFDSTPYQPSSITVEFDHGIDCIRDQVLGTALNDNDTGAVQLSGGNCNCNPDDGVLNGEPGHTLNSFSLPANGYATNSQNTFVINVQPDGSNCFGYSSQLLGGGLFARITVFP